VHEARCTSRSHPMIWFQLGRLWDAKPEPATWAGWDIL
jgi:hypothetical protein